MPRCKGITKSGARCRRAAAPDSEYCSWHSAEGEPETGHEEAPPGHEDVDPGAEAADDGQSAPDPRAPHRPRRQKHPLADAAVVGIIAVALMVLRRVIRR